MTERLRPTPLAGVTIVDLTQVLAGPYCTYILALLGADVIKVEPPGGEWTRRGGAVASLGDQGLGLTFCVQNGDKQVVEADLKDPDQRDAVLRLVDDADVFVQNYRPGVAERLGFGVDALLARNDRLVYCSLSAFGDDGPFAGRAAYDHVVQAASGVMELTGPPGSGPIKVGAPYVDYATGLNGALAVMAALAERQRTGQSQVVDVAMLDSSLALMSSSLAHVATTGRDIPKRGNDPASASPGAGCYRTADDRWFQFVTNTEVQFRNLCHALDRADWLQGRWASPEDRLANTEELKAELAEVIATDTAESWEDRFARHDVPGAAVRSLSDVIDSGYPDSRGLLSTIEVGESADPVRVPGLPFRMNGSAIGPLRPPRAAGADNDLLG